MGVGGELHAPAAFTPGKDPVPIVQEAEWEPGPVWIGAENLAPTGIRSPELSARSKSLYRLRCPGPFGNKRSLKKIQPVSDRRLATGCTVYYGHCNNHKGSVK
jgi:hypothetical protein